MSTRDRGKKGMGMTANEWGFLFGVRKMFWNYIGVIVAQPHDITKNSWSVHFKRNIFFVRYREKGKNN